MIKTFQHAKNVQTRRAASGKFGYAAAVRRFANRLGGVAVLNGLPRNVKAKRS